jgi:hypothetical protein
MPPLLTRTDILTGLRAALEPLGFVQALWEGGAAAFGRVDEWSDIDLQAAVDDDRVGEVFPLVEQALAQLGPIDLVYRIPEPAWHGHSQRFYRLANASPYRMIDFVVMKASVPEKFLQPEAHGNAVVHFDKTHCLTTPPLNPAAELARLQSRVEQLRIVFPLFQILTLKELHRGNTLEAIAFYHSATLRPLVELLRIQHAPARNGFYLRYAHYDLPPAVVARLHPLFYVADPAALAARRAEAEQWFNALLAALDWGAVEKLLKS